MALVILGASRCALCGELLQEGEATVASWGIFLPEHDPLLSFCDAALHAACFLEWSERHRFSRAYFDSMREFDLRNPFWATVRDDPDVFVAVQPDIQAVVVRSPRALTSWRFSFTEWESDAEWLRATAAVEGTVLAELMLDLRRAYPDAATLLARADLSALAEKRRDTEERQEWFQRLEEAGREGRRAFNRAARTEAETMRAHKLTCPHCGATRADHSFFERTEERRRSYFVCAACSRSFTHEDARGS